MIVMLNSIILYNAAYMQSDLLYIIFNLSPHIHYRLNVSTRYVAHAMMYLSDVS